MEAVLWSKDLSPIVLGMLDLQDIRSFSLVCKKALEMTSNDVVWKNQVYKRFGKAPLGEFQTWKNLLRFQWLSLW